MRITFKFFSTISTIFILVFILSGCSAIKHHERGGFYSGAAKVGENKRSSGGHDPNYGMGVGVVVDKAGGSFKKYIINPIDFLFSFALETLLLPLDVFYHKEYEKKEMLKVAREMKDIYYSVRTYKEGYMEDIEPLSDAIIQKKSSLIDSYIKNVTDINVLDDFGYTPLDYAIFTTQTEIVKKLIEEEKAKINPSTVLKTLQHSMMEPKTLEYLLSQGLDPNTTNKGKYTLLTVALRYKDVKMAMLLLEYGADINAHGYDDVTPFQMAIRHNNKELAEMFIKKGADIHQKNKWGENALFYAWEENLPVLINAGLDINAQNNGGKTPLIRILNNIYSDEKLLAPRVKAFLEAGADPNIAGSQGISALSTAAFLGYSEATKLLIQHGANIDAEDDFGRTALSQARFNKHSDIIKILLEAGASN